MDGYDPRHTCCFTGHRPDKLAVPEEAAVAWLEEQIDAAVAEGYTRFITGCAMGTDLWAGKIVLKKRQERPDLRLTAASPWPECSRSWPEKWKQAYDRVIREADEVVYIRQAYCRYVYDERNRWMADRSGRVIAMYTGAPGGTRRTVAYARRIGREVILFPGNSPLS